MAEGMKKKWQEPVLVGILLLVAAFVFLTNSPIHIWKSADAGTDSTVFQTVALMMENGYMPYVDSFDHKGPMIYIINLLGRMIAPNNGVWWIELLSLFVTFVFIYKIARMKCNVTEACITLFVAVSLLFGYFEGGNLVEEYAMPCIAVSLYIFLDYLVNHVINARRLIVCGACMSVVALLRVNMVSAWAVFSIAVLLQCIMEKKYQNIVYFLKFFLMGVGIVTIPIILWLVANHALMEFWQDYIEFNSLYISAEGGRALLSAKWSSFFTFLNNAVIIMTIVITAFFCKKKDFVYKTYIIYLFISILLICLSGRTYGHYGMILIPAVAFPFASAFEYLGKRLGDKANLVSKIISVYLLSVVILPSWLNLTGKMVEIYEAKDTEQSSNVVKVVCEHIANNTTAQDAISVYGNWNIIYLKSERMHATRYSYQFPVGEVMPEIMQEYWQELKEELPKLIVVQAGKYNDSIIAFAEENGYQMLWAENTENLKNSAIIYQRTSGATN